VGAQTVPPTPTANVTLRGNLNVDAPLAPLWDPTQPQATSTFSTSVTLFDSLGRPHQADVYYSKVADGSWEWHAMTDGANIELGVPGDPTEIASGTLVFDTEGRLTDVSQSSDFNPRGANLRQPLTFDFGDPVSTGGTGRSGITQVANASTTTFVNQDGSSAGDLASVEVDAQGNVTGAFTNGRSQLLGRVAVADFSAPDKLRALSGNMFMESADSGQPTIGGAGEGGRGSIIAGSLEQSNVDLAGEFVRMIAAQRGFQANSKTITTADQLLNELIALKR
jgi:flagellar hook protein FlgE